MGPEIAAAAAGAGQALANPALQAALVAGGTGAQMLAARQQARQQRRILDAQQARSDQVQQQGTRAVMDEAQTMAPAARMAEMQAAEAAAAQRAQQDMGAGGAMLDETAANPATAQVSGDFLRAKADSALAEGARRTAIARELAKVRSVGDVQQQQGMRQSSLAEALGSMYSSNRQRAQAAQLDASAVEEPWYGGVGRIASAVGTMGAMSAPTAAAGSGWMAATGDPRIPGALGDGGTAGGGWLGRARFGKTGAGPRLG